MSRWARIIYVLSCLLGSAFAAIFGLVVVIAHDQPLVAWALTGAFPVLALWLAGVRNRVLLAKVAVYALVGWIVCLGLGPARSQSAMTRARRLANDPWVGTSWYIPCYFVSGMMASVEVAFVPVQELTRRSKDDVLAH